jgi:hypothetical protein
MTNDPLPEAAEANRLTDVFRRAGVLGNTFVREVAVESSRTTILSRITRLRLTYDRADVDAPKSVILKTGLPERAEGMERAALLPPSKLRSVSHGFPDCFRRRNVVDQ